MSHPTENFPPSKPLPDPAFADLPPVEAPSAGFIVQLFVIPAVVVAVVIAVWLLFGKLAGGERDAMSYVEVLKSPSANFRTAFELASLIQNDPKLANDPRLLGELTDLLDHELKKDDNPKLTTYLALSLGLFKTLDAELGGGRKLDPLATLARALGEKQPERVRIGAAESLAKQAARLDGKLDDAEAVRALATASRNGSVELRRRAVFALGFFGGEGAVQVLRERLKEDEDRDVRYNAALALGRQGEPVALGTLHEMLTPSVLDQLVEAGSTTEKRSLIEQIELQAIFALHTSVSRKLPDLARTLRPEVEGLTKSGLVSVRNKAQELLKRLPPAP